MNSREKISLLLEITGKTQTVLAGELGVSFVSFNAWATGKAIPRIKNLELINVLLQKNGVQLAKNISPLSAKRDFIHNFQKKHKNVLKTIASRIDLLNEFSLQVTYNSNAIEGSTMTKEDTAEVIFEGNALSYRTLTEQIEAKNHHMAFLKLIDYISHGGHVNEVFSKELHRMLMTNVLPDAGQYRMHGVRIVGSFVPTANYLKVPDLMKDVFKKKWGKNILAEISKFHAIFEKIHPFSDGNGRIGRLLMIGMLLRHNIAPAIIAKKKRKEYYKALQEAQLEEKYEMLEEFVLGAILSGYKIISE